MILSLKSMQEYDKFSSGKFIMSHKNRGPMKMQEKEVAARKTGSLKLEGQ